MTDNRPVYKTMLSDPIDYYTEDNLDFDSAKRIADAKAKEKVKKPMLLAWYDKSQGRHSPDVVCGCGDKPSWLVYAQSREGNVSVDINNEEYVFIYRNGEI